VTRLGEPAWASLPRSKPTCLLIDRESRYGVRLRQLVNLVSGLYLESVTMAKTYSPTNWLGSFTTKRCPILKAATFLIVPDGLPKAELYAEPGMMPMTRAHMDSMMRMSPGQMSATMAAHDRMMSQMLDRMGSDMRNMKMSGDAKWNGLVDSVKADLAELPGLQGKELSARVFVRPLPSAAHRLLAVA
jgi:hypothetical protein